MAGIVKSDNHFSELVITPLPIFRVRDYRKSKKRYRNDVPVIMLVMQRFGNLKVGSVFSFRHPKTVISIFGFKKNKIF